MATALSTLRSKLAEKLRTYGVTGTCTGGSSTAVVDTGRDEENYYWNHAWVTITGTTDDLAPKGETRQVSDFATGAGSGTGTMTVLRAFSAAVQASDTYEVHKKFSVDELNDAINEAIRRARGRRIVKAIDTTTSITGVYDYALATSTGRVFKVELQSDKATATYPYIDITSKTEIRDDEGSLTLGFDFDPGDGYVIRYHHVKEQDELATDVATTDLPLDYIYAAGRAELYKVLASEAKDDNEYRRYMTSADDFDKDAEKLLRRYAKQMPAGKVIRKHGRLGGEGWYEDTYAKEDLK